MHGHVGFGPHHVGFFRARVRGIPGGQARFKHFPGLEGKCPSQYGRPAPARNWALTPSSAARARGPLWGNYCAQYRANGRTFRLAWGMDSPSNGYARKAPGYQGQIRSVGPEAPSSRLVGPTSLPVIGQRSTALEVNKEAYTTLGITCKKALQGLHNSLVDVSVRHTQKIVAATTTARNRRTWKVHHEIQEKADGARD